MGWRVHNCLPTWLPQLKPIVFGILGGHDFDIRECIRIKFKDDIKNGVLYFENFLNKDNWITVHLKFDYIIIKPRIVQQ